MSCKRSACQALGRAIRSARTEHGYSQRALAARVGMSHSYYGAIERGEVDPSVEALWKIADALDIGAGELLTQSEH